MINCVCLKSCAYGPSAVHGKAKTSEQNLQFHPIPTFWPGCRHIEFGMLWNTLYMSMSPYLSLSDQQRVLIQDVAGVMLRVVIGHPGFSLAQCSYVLCILYCMLYILQIDWGYLFDREPSLLILMDKMSSAGSSKTDLLSHLWPPQIELLQDHLGNRIAVCGRRRVAKFSLTRGLSWSAKFFISSPTASFPLGASTLSSTWSIFNDEHIFNTKTKSQNSRKEHLYLARHKTPKLKCS